MTTPWWQVELCTLDIESTGLNLEEDRVVEICFATIRPAAAAAEDRVRSSVNLIDPGIPMPAEASAVNGYTTERLQAEGGKPVEVLDVAAGEIARALVSGLPLVIMNAPYDLTIVDRDLRRNGLPTIVDRLDGRPLAPVIDPLVLDKELVKKRRRVSEKQGARQLKTLAQVWEVGWDDALAHAAEYDAMQAARVVWRMCQRERAIASRSPMELHELQIGWAAEQAKGLAKWFRSQGEIEKANSVRTEWPMVPRSLMAVQAEMAASRKVWQAERAEPVTAEEAGF